MRFNFWILSLWPGLWHAWQGEWRGLALAVCFAVGLNGALLSSFGILKVDAGNWPHQPVTALSWLLVLGLWSYGLLRVWRDWPAVQTKNDTNKESATEHFRQAQQEYLRGHWIETETLLRQLLRENSLDAEAQLLLASVQRRTRQWNQARKTLRALQETNPAAAKWLMEIEAELARIDELENETGATNRNESLGDGDVLRAA
jgi:hypothetical protein